MKGCDRGGYGIPGGVWHKSGVPSVIVFNPLNLYAQIYFSEFENINLGG